VTGDIHRRIARRAVRVGLAVALVALARPAAALELTLQTSRSEVTVGEQFTVDVNVSQGGMGKLPEPELPPVDGLRQVSSYTSQNFSYVNGRATSSLTLQYVMVADREGEFDIGPARAEGGGERATSGTVHITVKPAGSSTSAPRFGGETKSSEGDDLIVLGTVDNDHPYVNEQVTYTFTFLHRVPILQGGRYTAPSFQGFWAEDLDRTDPREVVVNGRRYTAERIRSALFPTGAGDYTIEKASVTTAVEDYGRSRRNRNPFDVFGSDPFGLFRSGRQVVLETDPITVHVQPLPEAGKPADFTGAVGEFQLSATADRTSLKAGEPVTLTVKLSGTGNVKVVPDPDLSGLDGFKVYESRSSDSHGKEGDRITGEKTWEFVLVPTAGGNVRIPSIRMGVFRPDRKSYEELSTKPIPLDVTATALDKALASGGDLQVAKERVKLQQRDIRWVKHVQGPLRRAEGSPFSDTGFLLAHFMPALAFVGAGVYRRQKDRLRSDVRYARNRAAARTAQKRLAAASGLESQGKLEEFFGALSSALRGYVADKLGLAAANLEEDAVRTGLTERGIAEEEVDHLLEMLGACDTARFSPLGTDATGAADLLGQAKTWITKAERR
jgi:BatD DUF11 like domain